MTLNPSCSYAWAQSDFILVFRFTIATGRPPAKMQLELYEAKAPEIKHTLQSADGEIVLTDISIGNDFLNGLLRLRNTGPDHGYVEAKLVFGKTLAARLLAGSLVKYYYTAH